MHFHDLRAKALTDKRRLEGAEAAQALAGHTTAKMTAHYTKSREVERVKPVSIKRAS
jgi:integrase